MPNNFKKSNAFFKILVLLFLFLIGTKLIFAQKSNLQVFYTLVDSSTGGIISRLQNSEKEIKLKLDLGSSYSVFENQIIGSFVKNNFNVNTSEDSIKRITSINYILDNAKVIYGDIFRDGLLGNYFIPRKVFISGNYLINSKKIIVQNFNYSFKDTVLVDNLKNLENYSFPFTKGEVPSEPFFSSLFEPLIAIGTAAIAVFLFFTIRSK
jgi:hypothetical protein